MSLLVSIDPGRNKCGLVLVDPHHALVLEGGVVEKAGVIDVIRCWHKKVQVKGMFLGNGTSSSYWQKTLKKFASIQIVEERGTTLRSRQRYWELWPPRNWRRLIPKGLMLPPHDLDAVAAMILLEDHLDKQLIWPGPPDFRIGLEL